MTPPAQRQLWILDDGRTFGGGQMNALRLAQFIGAGFPGWEVQVLCPEASELAQRCLAAGIACLDARFPDLSPAGGAQIGRAVASLRHRLKHAPEDVIVAGGSLRAQVYAHVAAAGLRRKPAIVQFMTEQDSARRRTGILLLSRFGAVVAVGGNAAKAYREALPGVGVVKVNNFLLPGELAGPVSPRQAHDRPPVLGVLARLIPEKGVLELLEELAAVRPAWATLLVGGNLDDDAYARRLEQAIESLGLAAAVSLLGHVEDVRRFCADIDLLVVPSVGNEGQPTVILEALSCDRPVIVREHVWSDDFDGLPVFPYRDASDLAPLLESVRDRPVDRGRLERMFGPEQVLAAFETAAGHPRRSR